MNTQKFTDKGFKLEKYPDGEWYVFRTGDNALVRKIFDVLGIEWFVYEDESMPNIIIQSNPDMTIMQYLIDDTDEVGEINKEEFFKLLDTL
jgi:hypothetical protein